MVQPHPTKSKLAEVLTLVGSASSDFDLNPDVIAPEVQLRDAAVLVPIWERPDGVRLILTKRAMHLKAHPGQVSFPGGRVEDADKSLANCALREAKEEIGLNPDSVEILGELPSHRTVTGFTMTPVLGWIQGPQHFATDPGEVAEVFHVPLDHALDAKNYSVQARKWNGLDRRFYAVPFGPYYIWGATARILRGLAERMAQ